MKEQMLAAYRELEAKVGLYLHFECDDFFGFSYEGKDYMMIFDEKKVRPYWDDDYCLDGVAKLLTIMLNEILNKGVV